MMSQNPSLNSWRSKGQYIDVNGHRVFVIDEGDQKDVLVILHGYPTCSFDYHAVLPLLSKSFRVVIHDHLGFGLSDRPLNYSYSLIDQADVAQQLWLKMGIQSAHLLAHDYGTSVATEIIARLNGGYEPVSLKSITIGNGSMLINMAKLLPVQRLLKSPAWGPLVAKLSSKWTFDRSMRRIWYDQSKIQPGELDVLYHMLWDHPNAKKTFPIVSRYIDERYRLWHRWITAGLYQCTRPINIIWADKDPVAVIDMAYELEKNIPENRLTIMKDLGHYPMLEDSEAYAHSVLQAVKGGG